MDHQIKGRTVDVTPLFKKAGILTEAVVIVETEGMYPYKEKVEDNWAYYTAVGMKELKRRCDEEGKIIQDIGIVGICSGVEGIAVAKIFRPKRLVVTDVDAGILQGTMVNLRRTTHRQATEMIPLVGSFCEPMEDAGYTVDFVHANIPNLPATGEEDLSKGAEKGTFLPAMLYEKYNPPQKYVAWALGAQFAYLRSARQVVRSGGSVITELGGRVPFSIIRQLFSDVGLEFSEVIVGFKEQTEALIDFLGYSRFEREFGVSFDFYLYNESQELLRQKGVRNPSPDVAGEELKEMLERYRVSAGEALELHDKGIPVGHTVHVFRGITY